jgi:hypothetical protein
MNFARNPFSWRKRVPIGICFVIILSKKSRKKLLQQKFPTEGISKTGITEECLYDISSVASSRSVIPQW